MNFLNEFVDFIQFQFRYLKDILESLTASCGKEMKGSPPKKSLLYINNN